MRAPFLPKSLMNVSALLLLKKKSRLSVLATKVNIAASKITIPSI